MGAPHRSGEIRLRYSPDPGVTARQAIDDQAHVLATLLGGTRFKVRFPAPVQKELLA